MEVQKQPDCSVQTGFTLLLKEVEVNSVPKLESVYTDRALLTSNPIRIGDLFMDACLLKRCVCVCV